MNQRKPSRHSLTRVERALGRSSGQDQPLRSRTAVKRESWAAPSSSADHRLKFTIGVTTFNRLNYIRKFISTFEATKSASFSWTLIVADDGSSDGTWQYLRGLEPTDYRMVLIRNNAARIAGQTNSIFLAAQALGFDMGFKADDDIYFNAKGWDELYYTSVTQTGLDHLVYHNEQWKPGIHKKTQGKHLRSFTSAENCMGCFYTFTPQLLSQIGFLDEVNFPIRGHSHIDFTVRSCRLGFNDETSIWDAQHSDQFIGMWRREEYDDLTDWNSDELKRITGTDEQRRRFEVIRSPDRAFLSLDDATERTERLAVFLLNGSEGDLDLLTDTTQFYSPGPVNAEFDRVYVLNLTDDRRKWAATSRQLSRREINFHRYPGVFGGEPPHLYDWVRYEQRGLTHPVERRLNRKLIQSPGAWGYLLTMRELLRQAKSARYRRILIFDDDVRLHRDFSSLFEDFISEISPRYSVLFLGGTQRSWTDLEELSEHSYRPNEKLDGSFAVGLDASVIDPLLEKLEEFVWPFDAGPLREVALAAPDSAFVAKPNLAIPDVSHSSIRERRQLDDLAELARWDVSSYEEREPALPRRLSNRELVSVLILAEDASAPLLNTIDSLRLQTYAKLEILVGFLNNLPDLADMSRITNNDTRITLIAPNGHGSEIPLLNELLERSTGELITVIAPGTVSVNSRIENARTLAVEAECSVVRGALHQCDLEPAGIRNGVSELGDWISKYGTGHKRKVVELINREVFDAVGGFAFAGEGSLLEVTDRLDAGGRSVESIVSNDVSGIYPTGSTQTSEREWIEFHSLIRAKKLQPYVRASGFYDSLISSRPVNSGGAPPEFG